MPKELPSDEEIRAALRRSRPNWVVEAVGCFGVLACAAVGAWLGLVAFQWLGSWEAYRAGRLTARGLVLNALLIPAGGAAGLGVGVVAYHWARRLAGHRT
jgi:hypothetical protein